jgi:hypothetical protein
MYALKRRHGRRIVRASTVNTLRRLAALANLDL